MAKTHIGKRPRISAADKGKRPATPRLAQHKEFRDRVNRFQARPWIIERGIDLESMAQTPIPAAVAARQWERYVARPTRPNRSLVIEFYASAMAGRLQDGGVVVVQGVEILINPEVINQFFEVPDIDIVGRGGVEYLDTLDPFRGRMAAILRMDGLEQWDMLLKLFQRDTHVDVAFWNIFLTCSLLPSQHRTEIFYDQARILLRLRTGGPINIGRVIFRAIREACGTDELSMVFPCLITALCSRAGIDVTAGLEPNDPSMLTRTRWNQQLALRGLPPVGDYARRRRHREERAAAAAAMAPEQPEGDPAAEQPEVDAPAAQPGGDQFHTLLQAMKAHMDLR